jgi:hypothetical protein
MIKSRRMRWAGHVAQMDNKRNACMILVGKSEEKRPLGRRRRMWKDNIKMDLRAIGWGIIDWIDLVQVRGHWRPLEHGNGPSDTVKYWGILQYLSD